MIISTESILVWYDLRCSVRRRSSRRYVWFRSTSTLFGTVCQLLLLDYLPDTMNPTPDEQTFEKALTESIEEALSHLKERESKILRLYFGLDGSEPMTLEEIGALLGITRERVRQIKEKALSRLRHVSRARALESYLG